ncbi:MAG: DUF4233 domain-containing protein [Kineosporiaceae bacterium]
MRSLKRTLAASVLAFEALVWLFAGLVGKDLADVPPAAALSVGLALMVVCVLVAGALRRPGGYAAGWVLQVLMLAAGWWLPAMWVVGVAFAALWWTALRQGGRLDALAAARAAQASPSSPPA